MEKPTKILIGGVLCAALIAGVGALNTARLKANLKALEARCGEDGKKDQQTTGTAFEPTCDGDELSRLAWKQTGPFVGIQADILAAHDNVRNSPAKPGLLAIGFLIVSVIPWAWYFLLRRIRELRDAVVGK